METKLTVRVLRHLLENAKRYARENNTTITKLITAYLQRLTIEQGELENAPVVRGLTGSLSPDVTLDDYKKHLNQKYVEGSSRNRPCC